MFQLNSKTVYTVEFVRGGITKSGIKYSFITVKDEIQPGQQYPDKLNIKLWGDNLENKLLKGSGIRLAGCSEVGVVSTQDKNDKQKWYKKLTITCRPEDLLLGTKPLEPIQPEIEEPEVQELEPIEELPF